MDAWEDLERDLAKLNPRFNKKHDDFIRQYTHGNTVVALDTANRILIPRRLLDFAAIGKDVVMKASINKIEMWSARVFDGVMNSYNPDAFAALAEETMGNQKAE